MPSSSSSSSDEDHKRIKVAVIGAGTGLTAAWAADASEELDVWVFEAKPEVGGNIQSPVIAGKAREAGAEFLGPKGYGDDPEDPDRAYRDTHRLLDVLKVKRQEFPLTMSFRNLGTGEEMTLPPIEPYFDDENSKDCMSGFLSCMGLFKKTQTATKARIALGSLWDHFFDLIELKKIIDEADKIKINDDFDDLDHGSQDIRKTLNLAKQKSLAVSEVMTLEDLVEAFIEKGRLDVVKQQRRDFADTILYPLIAAGWGLHQVQEIKSFCAHYAMHYLEVKGKWYHVPEGIHSYFDKILTELSPRTKVYTNCPIAKAIPVQVERVTKYQLVNGNGELIKDSEGEPVLFDDLIIATPAYATAKIIAPIKDEETQALRKKLKSVEYFATTIIHHQDPHYHFKNRTVANTIYDPIKNQAYNTMVKYFNDDVKKAWLLPGQPKPEKILHESKFWHAKMTRSYYDSEHSIHHLQGKNGVFYGGTMAGRGDAHESGIRVNLQVIAKCLIRHGLNPADNPRLQHFPENLASVHGWTPPKTEQKRLVPQKLSFLSSIIVSDSESGEDIDINLASVEAKAHSHQQVPK